MKVVHLLRSQPSDLIRRFVEDISKDKESIEVPLYQEPVDYDQLIGEIFEGDQVICWW